MTASSPQSQRWGVVGGGMLGMTLALRLAQKGHRVTLLEAGSRLGGLADAWQVGDVTWDRHYHVICLSDSVLRGMLDELGLGDELQWQETRTGFYGDDGRLVSITNNADILRNLPLSWLEKIRLGLSILYAGRIKDGAPLEAVHVEEWLRKISGDQVFQQLWLPLLRAKLSDNYTKASAFFIWTVIARLSKARDMGFDKERFGYIPGGYARIVAAFERALRDTGVELIVNAPSRLVERAADGMSVATEDGSVRQFDQVAVTIPAGPAATVCKGLLPDELDKLNDITYQGIVCASLLLKQPLADYYLTYITDTGIPFTAVVEMSTLVDKSKELGGKTLVYLPKYVTTDDPLLTEPDARIRESFLAGLRRMYPHFSEDDVEAFQVSRVPRVLAIPTLHYSSSLPAITTSVPGLHILNSAHITNGTLNVNETMTLAEREARRLAMLPLPSTREKAEAVHA